MQYDFGSLDQFAETGNEGEFETVGTSESDFGISGNQAQIGTDSFGTGSFRYGNNIN